MDEKRVKDVMLPLEEYAVVPEDATFRDAILVLDKAQQELPRGRQPHRAVLVVDRDNKIVGKVGQLSFLRALEPKYGMFSDLDKLARARITPEFLTRIMEELQFWQDSISACCGRATSIKVKDFMNPVTECVDENAPLSEAIHRIIMWQTLSILVTRQDQVVGILRLSDLFAELTNHVKAMED